MKNRLALTLAAVAGGCVAVGTAQAQLVVGNDQSSGAAIWLMDLSGVQANRSLVTGAPNAQNIAWGVTADDVNGIMYWNNGSTLYKASYDMSNPMVPVLIGTTVLGAVGGPTASLTGLAWDSVDNTLIGARNISATGFPVGLYNVDPVTGVCTLAVATVVDLGAIDFDAGTNAFYAWNDSTSTTPPVSGRGVYRLNKPLSAGNFTNLGPYPSGDTDIDGGAMGNGRVYGVNDVGSQGIFVWNLSTSSYEASLVSPLTATSATFAAGAWAPGLLIPPTGADLGVTKVSNPGTLVVPPGGDVTYVVTVRNNGPELATGVAMSDTLPAGMTFVSVDGGASHNAGVVSANIGDLASGETRVFNIVVTTSTLGSYVNNATVSGTSTDNNPGNNSANATTIVRGPQADLSVAITDPADCAVGQGGTIGYSIAVSNAGTEAAESPVLLVTLPEGVTFQSSTPPVVPVGSNLTFNLATLGNGGSDSVSILATATQSGSQTINASVSSTTTDPSTGNNSDVESTLVAGSAPATAAAKGFFSNIATSDSSIVPGTGGAERFDNGLNPPGRPFRSPFGTGFIQAWSTNAATTQDSVLVVYDLFNDTGRVVAREDVTVLPTLQGTDVTGPPYHPFSSFDPVYGINDEGDYVFSGIDDRSGATDDGYVIKGNLSDTLTLIGQENVTEAPTQTGGTFYGSTRGSVGIAQNGQVSMLHQIAGLAAANDEHTLRTSGSTTVTQEQVTVVAGIGGVGSFTVNDVENGSAQLGFFMNADHSAHCYRGTLFGQPTTSDQAVIVNAEVKIQEGFAVPGSGFANAVTTIAANRMESNSDWFVRGSNITDGHDWVVRNGAVVAQTGAPIFTGATEVYGDTSFAATFYMMLGNNLGDYVVGGVTTDASNLTDAVLVLNNTTVLLRENDPIDLDNNGQFDDGVYLRTFIDDRAFMTDTDLFVVVRLRDAAAAVCGATDTDIGQALIRIALPPTGPSCDGDVNCDFALDGFDVEVQEKAVGGDMTDYCQADPDFNGDFALDGFDVEAVEIVVGGGPCP